MSAHTVVFDLDHVATFIPFSAAKYSTLKGKQIQFPDRCIDVCAFPPTCIKLAISLDPNTSSLNNVSRYSCLLHRLIELTPLAADLCVYAPVSTSSIMRSHFLEACRLAGLTPRQVIQIPMLMAQRALALGSQGDHYLLTIHLTLRRLELSLFSFASEAASKNAQIQAHSSMRVEVLQNKRPSRYLTAFYEDDELAATNTDPVETTNEHFLHTEVKALLTHLQRQQPEAMSQVSKFVVTTDMPDHQSSLISEVTAILASELPSKPQRLELDPYPSLLRSTSFSEKFQSILGGALGFELLGFKCPSLLPAMSSLPISRLVPVTATCANNAKLWFSLLELIQDAPLGPPSQYKQSVVCNIKPAASSEVSGDIDYSLEVEVSIDSFGAPRVSIKDPATGVRQLISPASVLDVKNMSSQLQDSTDTATTIDSDPHHFRDEVSPSESPSLRSSVEDVRICQRVIPASTTSSTTANNDSISKSTSRKCSPASMRLSRHHSAESEPTPTPNVEAGSSTSRRKASPVLESRLHSRQLLSKRAQEALRPLCPLTHANHNHHHNAQSLRPSSLTRSALEAATGGKTYEPQLGISNPSRIRLHTNPNVRHDSDTASASSRQMRPPSPSASAIKSLSVAKSTIANPDAPVDGKSGTEASASVQSSWHLCWDDDKVVLLRMGETDQYMGFYKADGGQCIPFTSRKPDSGDTEQVTEPQQVLKAFESTYKAQFGCEKLPEGGQRRAEVLDLCFLLRRELSSSRNKALEEELSRVQAIMTWLSECPHLGEEKQESRLRETYQHLEKIAQGMERCKLLKARTELLIKEAEAMSLPQDTRRALADLSADLQSMVGDRLTEESEKVLSDLESNIIDLKGRAVIAKIETVISEMFMSKFGSQMPLLPMRSKSGETEEFSAAINRLLLRCSVMADTSQMVGRLEMCIRRIRDEYRRRHFDKLYRQQYAKRLRKAIRRAAEKLWGTSRSVTMSDLEAHISELEATVGEDLGPLIFMKNELEQYVSKVKGQYVLNPMALFNLSEGQRLALNEKCTEVNVWLHQSLEQGDVAVLSVSAPSCPEGKSLGPHDRGRPPRDVTEKTEEAEVKVAEGKCGGSESPSKERVTTDESKAGSEALSGDTDQSPPAAKASESTPADSEEMKENKDEVQIREEPSLESEPTTEARGIRAEESLNRSASHMDKGSPEKSVSSKPKAKGVLSVVDPTKVAIIGEKMAQRRKEIEELCESMMSSVKEAVGAKTELENAINETIDHYENELRPFASPLECHEATTLIFASIRWNHRHACQNETSAHEYNQHRLHLQEAYNRLVVRIKSKHRSAESQRFGVEGLLGLSNPPTSCGSQRRSTDTPFTPQTARTPTSQLPFPFANLPAWTPRSIHFA